VLAESNPTSHLVASHTPLPLPRSHSHRETFSSLDGTLTVVCCHGLGRMTGGPLDHSPFGRTTASCWTPALARSVNADDDCDPILCIGLPLALGAVIVELYPDTEPTLSSPTTGSRPTFRGGPLSSRSQSGIAVYKHLLQHRYHSGG